MKKMSSRMGVVRPVAAAALAAAIGFSGEVQATIDRGWTIDSVTSVDFSSANANDGTQTYGSITTLSQHEGVYDSLSGLNWIKASSLEEGQALGYRAATSSEFSSLMLDKSWTATPSSQGQWSLTTGFDYKDSRIVSSNYGGTYATTSSVTNLAPFSFSKDATVSLAEHMGEGTGGTDVSVTLGLLDGGVGQQVAAWLDRDSHNQLCYGSNRTSGCMSANVHVFSAVVADLQRLKSGAYDTASSTDWATTLATLPAGQSPSYFMVAAIPEPGTQALMGLGLVGLLLLARHRRGN
jgi:hypothetical protein